MKTSRKLRFDSYEANLSPEERERLHEILSDPALSMEAMREQAPVWPAGKFGGKKPNRGTLMLIRTRLRREDFLTTLEANARVSAAAEQEIKRRYKGKGDIQERMLNRLMTMMSEEALQKTLDKLDPEGRTAATRLLLQHSRQKIEKQKLELAAKKAEQAQEKSGAVTEDALARAAEELKLL